MCNALTDSYLRKYWPAGTKGNYPQHCAELNSEHKCKCYSFRIGINIQSYILYELGKNITRK